MLRSLTTLILCQAAGEAIARGAGLPLPGPVVGLVLLLLLLIARGGPDPELKRTASGLLSHLSLLFVPAGVGVVTELGVLGANWLPVTVALIASTGIGLAVTGYVMQRISGRPP